MLHEHCSLVGELTPAPVLAPVLVCLILTQRDVHTLKGFVGTDEPN
jgi:hypothetical protein